MSEKTINKIPNVPNLRFENYSNSYIKNKLGVVVFLRKGKYNPLKEKQDFSYTEAIIADGILKKGMDFEKSSARKIAKEIHVAPSTLVRFCQKLGFQGFNDFKEAYLKELNYTHSHFIHIDANYPFAPQDKNVVIAHKIGQLYHECIDDVLTQKQSV